MYESTIAQHNEPIWRAEGNVEQAETSKRNAEDYRAAIDKLKENQ